MKIYVSKINESWIVDRFRDEWIKNNSQINTTFAFKADIIWLIAPWVWRNISKKNLAKKKLYAQYTILNMVTSKELKEKNFLKEINM